MHLHMNDNDVIEAEVLSETTYEVKKSDKPKKNVTYLSKGDRGERLLRIASSISRFSYPAIFFFAAGGLTFSILFSQSQSVGTLILLLICWSGSLLSLIASITASILGARARRLLQEESEGK